ncbi:MAG: T9SS type A sorting domain-containing protein [Myroides sp.]|nr:T9SS type A sorting domain-containing protein [Myroides sp.]
MKKSIFILIVNFFSVALFAQTNTFVPQQMQWGTYLQNIAQGGSKNNILSIANGGVVLVGYADDVTLSYTSQLITPNAHQTQISGFNDGHIYGFNSDGTLRFGTYFGGEANDEINILATDAQNNTYVYGNTFSYTNIATNQTQYSGYVTPPFFIENPITGEITEIEGNTPMSDGVLAKFTDDGALLWSTYVTGQRGLNINNAILGQTGIYVFGYTLSVQNFATAGAYQPNWPVGVPQDNDVGTVQPDVAFMAKYSLTGEKVWSTYMHGFNFYAYDYEGVTLDEQDNIYCVKNTNGYQLVKFNSDGQWQSQENLPANTGGVYTKVLVKNNNFYLVGRTSAADFGTTGTFKPEKTAGVQNQFFLMKCNSALQKQWATYLPATVYWQTDRNDVLLDEDDNIYVGNSTNESGLATTGVFQLQKNGEYGAYALKLNTNGALQWFTYFGDQITYGNSGGFIELAGKDGLYVFTGSPGTENIVNENGFFSEPSDVMFNQQCNCRLHLTKLVAETTSTDNFLKDKIKVYPNPVTNYLTVDVSDELLGKSLSYTMYDNLGRVIAKKTDIDNQQLKINVEKYASGIYNLQIIDNQSKVFQNFKIVKE